jgi:hypothetical protein
MIIPFNRKFEPEERENRQHLIDSLTRESSGILNMALAAYAKAIQRKDFTLPPSVKDAVEEWREDADPMQSFIRDILVKDNEKVGEKPSPHQLSTRDIRSMPKVWASSIFPRILFLQNACVRSWELKPQDIKSTNNPWD